MRNKFILVFLFFCSLVSSQELLPFVENFSKSDYKGDNQVWSISQSKDGALYFANNHYLLRFNGVKWEKYSLPNKTIIRSVYCEDNKIYTGSYNEIGYWTRKNGKLIYTSLSKNKKLFVGDAVNEEIWKIFRFQDKIFFQSFNQLFIYDGKEFKKINFPSQISYCFPLKEKLYVASVTNGLYVFQQNKFVSVSNWPELNKNIIHAIDQRDDQTYVFTKKNGVYIEENGVLIPWNHPLNSNLKTELINTAKFIGEDKLVIGTAFKGLYVIDLKTNSFVNINRNNSLKNNSVLSLGVDFENDLWLGMDNGIVHVEINSPYLIFNDNTGILGTVYSILPEQNTYLIGSNHGFFKLENKLISFINGTQGQVWSIDKIDGKIIIGHNDATLQYDDGIISKLSDINGGWKILKDIYDGSFYQGSYSGIVNYTNSSFSKYNRIEKLTKPIKNIAQNNKNTIWAVDSYKSLYRIDFDENKRVKKIYYNE